MYPHFLRKSLRVSYERERLTLPDQDFVDLDFIRKRSDELVIVLHGLEGSSQSHYAKGMVRAMSNSGKDVLVMNQRGCSGEINKVFASYHSGRTDDLDYVVNKMASNDQYRSIYIIGFSLGGNISLKYGGEMSDQMHPKVKGIVAISVPTDLSESSKYMTQRRNYFYMLRFRRMLKKKLKEKVKRHGDANVSLKEIKDCRSFQQFDNLYTAPAHGFMDAMDYYNKNSSKQYIENIKVPSLIINALDDPFFGPKSHPFEEVQSNEMVTLLSPKYGGHCGFAQMKVNGTMWHERISATFIDSID